MAEMFSNDMGLIIVCASYFEICPIWLWMYMINVRLYHWPILMMAVSLSPCRFRDIPPPCSEKVWNFTCWIFDGCAVGGADGAMKIGIGVYMGGCLKSAPMIPSLSSSTAWAEHEKYYMGRCLKYAPIIPSFSSSTAWAEHEKYEMSLCLKYALIIPSLSLSTANVLVIFMWYVQCEVELEYEFLFFVVGSYAIVQGKLCNNSYIWM